MKDYPVRHDEKQLSQALNISITTDSDFIKDICKSILQSENECLTGRFSYNGEARSIINFLKMPIGERGKYHYVMDEAIGYVRLYLKSYLDIRII